MPASQAESATEQERPAGRTGEGTALTARRSRARAAHLWLVLALLAGGAYLGIYLTRMWYPHDEGMLGQSAERVLRGEVPHRDFDEPYTGLLSYVHAAAFAIGGVRLPVLRVPLFIVTLCWMAAVFRIALRSTGPPGAAAVTLVALAWSVPNYPASVPSWYNLFFATFGVAALLRWDESGRSRWLLLAGLAGGISFLFKLSGLFYVAGAGLFLLYATRLPPVVPERPARASRVFAVAVTLALLLLVLLLVRSLAPHYTSRAVYQFVLPIGLLALALAIREWRPPLLPFAARARACCAAVLPFGAGVALPLVIFGAFFALAGGFPELIHGVFVAPFRRVAAARMEWSWLMWSMAAVPLAILLRPRPEAEAGTWRFRAMAAAVLLGLALVLAYSESFAHRFVWQSLRGSIPITAAIAAAVLVWPRLAERWAPASERRFVALAFVTAFASLIQFPFSASVYFLYVAPLFLLTLVALVQGIGKTPAPVASVTLGFYGLFAALLVTPGAVTGAMGSATPSGYATATLNLPRAHLRVLPEDARVYETLIDELVVRAAGGPIWAGPDAPEVYFLGGFRNRTRALFDFLGDAGEPPPSAFDGVTAVVINTAPAFSPRLPEALMASLRARFPEGRLVGRFELRWRR